MLEELNEVELKRAAALAAQATATTAQQVADSYKKTAEQAQAAAIEHGLPESSLNNKSIMRDSVSNATSEALEALKKINTQSE